MFPALDRFVSQQQWLDELGDPLQKYVNSLFSQAGESGKQVKNALNGTWLGHPLHPVLTDVPVGAWTMTLILDGIAAATDNSGLEAASDVCLGAGLAAAVGAAITGVTDWTDTYGKERKVGLAHGLTMSAATSTYLLSLLLRRAGMRKTGVALSNMGIAIMSAGAYLGGDEVYDIGYGVNHTAFEHGPSEYTEVMRESDLEEDKPVKTEAGGVAVMLVKTQGSVYALADTCVHAGCSLAGGTIEDGTVICPCHGSQYRLVDGMVVNGPATMPEPYYDVRTDNGMIAVRVRGD